MPERLREDTAAVSEVVGALLLVVIVSTAAFSFGLFVNQQQKKTQQQQALADDKRLEDLDILAIRPTLTGSQYTALSLDIVNLSSKAIGITGVRVQDAMQTSGSCSPSCTYNPAAGSTPMAMRTQLTLDFTGLSIAQELGIKVALLTERGNHFARAFVPPAPVIRLDQQGSDPDIVYTLDASESRPGGADGFLVEYKWEIYSSACGTGAPPAFGKRVQHNPPSAGTYCIRLLVTDGAGLVGTRELSFALT